MARLATSSLFLFLLAIVSISIPSCSASDSSSKKSIMMPRHDLKNTKILGSIGTEAAANDMRALVNASLIEAITGVKTGTSTSDQGKTSKSTAAVDADAGAQVDSIAPPAPAPGAVNVGVQVNVAVAQHIPPMVVGTGGGVSSAVRDGGGKTVLIYGGSKMISSFPQVIGFYLGKSGVKLVVPAIYTKTGSVATAFRAVNPTGDVTYILNEKDFKRNPFKGLKGVQALHLEGDEKYKKLVELTDYLILLPPFDEGSTKLVKALHDAKKDIPKVCLTVVDKEWSVMKKIKDANLDDAAWKEVKKAMIDNEEFGEKCKDAKVTVKKVDGKTDKALADALGSLD